MLSPNQVFDEPGDAPMQDLRLIGVHEDGMHVIFADDSGHRYRVELDEPLRAAARRDRAHMGQLQVEMEGVSRPRDVQAMIRAGLSADEVADRAGWSVEKVHRYEGPILAEREHVAGLAREVRLRWRVAGHGTAPTLGARVAERLSSREIDPALSRWDARRVDRGTWTVLLYFNAGGRQRQAAWDFDPLTSTITATDDEARWLSEDDADAMAGPLPAPHLEQPVRPSRVYDVEAEGGVGAPRRRRSDEAVDLMTAMRERSSHRGRRRRPKSRDTLGPAPEPEDALPLEQVGLSPEAQLHPDEDPAAGATTAMPTPEPDAAASTTPSEPAEGDETQAGSDEAQAADPGVIGTAENDHQMDANTPDDANPPEAEVEGKAEVEMPPEAKTAPEAKATPQRPSSRRSGRPSVPSWDDVMFGRKED